MSKWADPSPQLMQRYRILSGMTLVEAAEAANTYPANISDWENGKHKPNAKSLAKLAKAYDRDVSFFYEVNISTIKTEATSEVLGYFRNPKANIDRKASVASNLLIQLPETKQTEEEDTSKSLDEVLTDGDSTQT